MTTFAFDDFMGRDIKESLDAEEVLNLFVVPGAHRERDRDTLQLLT